MDISTVVEYQLTIYFIDGKLYKRYYTLANFLYFKNLTELEKESNEEEKWFNDRQKN